jgi:hypothetical protein
MKPFKTNTLKMLIDEDTRADYNFFFYWYFLTNETPENIKTYSRKSKQVFFSNMIDLEDDIWLGLDITNNFLKGANGYQ